MKLLVVVTVLGTVTLPVAPGQPDPALDWHWQLWKKTYGKEYRHEVPVSEGSGVEVSICPRCSATTTAVSQTVQRLLGARSGLRGLPTRFWG